MRLCEQYENMISAFIDGVLSEEDRKVLMDHMASCPDCQTYFDQQIAIHDAIMDDAARNVVEAPEGFAAEVMARVRFTPQEKPSRRKAAGRWRQWAALAACCAIAAAGFWTVRTDRVPLEASQETNAAAGCADPTAAMPETTRRAPEAAAEPADGAVPVPEPAPEEDAAITGGSALFTAPPPEETALDAGAPPASPYEDKKEGPMEAPLAEAPDTTQDAAKDPQEALSMPSPASGFQAASVPEETGEVDRHDGSSWGAYRCVMTASGPAVRAWLEAQGLVWEEGGFYELSAGEYAQLCQTLTDAGESFTEETSDAENSEGFLLITEESAETD